MLPLLVECSGMCSYTILIITLGLERYLLRKELKQAASLCHLSHFKFNNSLLKHFRTLCHYIINFISTCLEEHSNVLRVQIILFNYFLHCIPELAKHLDVRRFPGFLTGVSREVDLEDVDGSHVV